MTLIALMSAIALLIVTPSAFAYIYWVSDVNGRADMFRANLDGTGKRQIPVPGADGEGMVAAGNYLYSVTIRGIARWDADGSHHKLLVRVDPSSIMAGFHLTVAGSHIYWNSIDPNDDEVEISRANLDGTDVQIGYIKPSSNPMTGSELAVEGDYIYWFDEPTPDTVAIGRARLDGTDFDENFISFPTDASTQPYLIAAGPYLYFNTNNLKTEEDRIGRTLIDGSGTPELDFIDLGVRDSAYALFAGMAIAGSHIYFGHSANNAEIGRVNLDGSRLEHRLILIKGCVGCLPAVGGIAALTAGTAGQTSRRH